MNVLRPALAAALAAALLAPIAAQTPAAQTPAEELARRVDERLAALEAEAADLAARVGTLLGEVQTLEAERDRAARAVTAAEAAVADADARVAESTGRLEALEARRLAEAPDVAARLVEIYKEGRGGDVRLLLGVSGVTELGRAARLLAALTDITERRLEEHRRTIEAVRDERAALQARAREQQVALDDAERARGAAARAVAARDALIGDIDARRDLNAELTGALQLAATRLDQQLADLAAGRPVTPLAVPIAPFRGTLPWPAPGTVRSGFGRPSARLGGAPLNGIEIDAAEGEPVVAVHPGRVQFAGSFTGFNTLVILDHGDALSLYGYLADTSVRPGDRVNAGDRLGTVGLAPAGPAGLYFELRVDGRSADPVEWLAGR